MLGVKDLDPLDEGSVSAVLHVEQDSDGDQAGWGQDRVDGSDC